MTFDTWIEPTIVASLLGLLGIVIAALLAGAGYLYRAAADSKKGRRRVLYYSLEIRYAAATALFDPKRATEEYIQHLIHRFSRRGIPVVYEQIPDAAKATIASFFETIVTELRRDMLDRLIAPYEIALLEMAAEDPVTAYRLRGREKLERLMGHAKQYKNATSAVFLQQIKDTSARLALESLSTDLTDDALNELERTLRDDVLAVATACGRSDRRKCEQVLNRSLPEKRYRFDDLNDHLDAAVEKLIQALTRAAANQT